MTAPLLNVCNVTRAYGGVQALRGVDFQLQAGEVHALIGANGAGKSTLCRIIAGIEQPSSGTLQIDGNAMSFESVRDAQACGIAMVHQELSLFPELSVAENIYIGSEIRDRFGFVDSGEQERRAGAALAQLGGGIDPKALVGSLPVGLQQVVEIAKVLIRDTRILILDEPTSALSRSEIPLLFEVIRGLAARGVAIIYISHRLDELLQVCGGITVLRDGLIVAQAACADITPDWIVAEMTGRALGVQSDAAPLGPPGQLLLSVQDLRLPHRPGRPPLHIPELRLHAGEVVGIYGLNGAGRTEFLETLMGLHGDAQGAVLLADRDLGGLDAARRIAAGLALVPEDRQRDGLLQNMSVQSNMTLSSLSRISRHGLLRADAERTHSQGLVQKLQVKTSTLGAPIGSLSGGNQQKVVLARCLMSGPKVLLLDEPTRGVDVAAKAEILGAMRTLAADGMAVIFASSDASEILSASTRILVFSRGRIALDTTPARADETLLAGAASVAAQISGDAA